MSKKIIKINENLSIGADFLVIAGPCSVESYEQTLETAIAVKKAGANVLRGGAFKPRTRIDSFQGLEIEGIKILHQVGKELNMPIITEIPSETYIELFDEYVDIIQVGARNMDNYYLLKKLGQSKRPIFLKRGMQASIDELLYAAEYIIKSGNPNVILCERGIRTFETSTRNTLDISVVPVVKSRSDLPIFVDPSHAAGKHEFVESLSLAALAIDADGIMIEVHIDPAKALSDERQALKPANFEKLMKKIAYLKPHLKKVNDSEN